MHDGRYLVDRGLASSIVTSAVTVTKPSYWTLTEMRNGTNVGQSCVSKVLDDGDSSIKSSQFLILRDTEKVRSNLRSGAIGCYAYPEQDIYHSVGDPEQITIMNHLSTSIYAAVSGAGMGKWENTGQWAIGPAKTEYWLRAKDESAHVSRPGSIGGQSAQVHAARLGMILHIQKMPSQQVWQGIQSVANKTRFDIHVSVFSAVQGENTKQYSMKPGVTEYWNRTHPETVFVSVGSSPGIPKAYLGRPGFVLNITSAI
ncbi:hypothetical protein DFP72DRAFT_915038 [Ephemerocybe angulata]|uniref:Uncharacterized protein n=1 Tax=Ephemerocybe angulata TaxID=980116 RepID=A0A8H6M279_9AGAR|nr:hypothetical protein DFP72DRAFT_915038 [Tulosesus angulatus]